MEQLATGYGIVEGPVWDPAKGLYFSDVSGGGVHLLGLDDKVATVIPERRGVGGITLHEAGGIVTGGPSIARFGPDYAKRGDYLTAADASAATGFNDITTDPQGRVLAGSLGYNLFNGEEMKPGCLWLVDLDGTVRQVSDGILLTNGLGFSPDGKLLYHSDSRRDMVRVYDVRDDGTLGHWRCFVHFGNGSVPDGLKVAADGSVWVADARKARVAIFEADGRHRGDIAVPLPMVTSLCFAGDDLRDLYVVTGSRGAPTDRSGTLYRTRSDIPGLPLAPCRVKVS